MIRPKANRLMLLAALCTASLVGPFGCAKRAAVAAAGPSPVGPTGSKLIFNESIEPILSENCYPCHGPDPGARKAGLRLDRANFAFALHEKSGPAILARDPDHSPLVRRVESKDPKQLMPPREAHKTLLPEQIALLRRWVKEGAEYQDHWSFVPPRRPALPALRRQDWARNDIDRFILSRLEREGLEPSPEADRPTLIRRVSYDLTGLPPTPEEVDAFTQDPSPDAYEKVVDRLLASAHYGEHRAHYWLDFARYGDSHGLYSDELRSIWPYRDYVIRSFNANKPFDEFTREQIAGDLLPPTNVDQLVATAFIRAGISNNEGGTIPEELRVNNQRERTEAFGAVYLGLTTGCAVCHDHKFDPITQKDFYQLSAFFNNLTELPTDKGNANWPPYVNVPKPENRAAFNAALARKAAIERQIAARRRQARALITAWLQRGDHPPQPVGAAGFVVRLRLNEQTGSLLANSAPQAAFPSVTATGDAPVWGEDTWFWPSFRMGGTTRIEMPQIGDIEKDQAFSVGTWIMPHFFTSTGSHIPFGTIVSRLDSAHGSRGWEIYYDRGIVSVRLIHQLPGDAIVVKTVKPVLFEAVWNHVLATYDGSGRAAGVHLYIDGKQPALTVAKDSLRGSVRTSVPLEIVREYPDANALRLSRYQDFRFYTRALSPAEAARVAREDYVAELSRRPPVRWTEDEFKAVSDFYFAKRDATVRALAAQLPPLDAAIARLSADGDPCLICQETPRLAYADILARGVYSERRERVGADVPHFLPPLEADAPRNRLALANWLVSPANPLTARVAVNRMWQEIFGDGLVETPGDFGLMGERPSHPALLDWLAVDFRESGWNVKRLYRELVLSATYRQSARTSPALLERDPHNRLLARGPRFRMDGEMVRDTALATSGLLVDKVGGPSVKPYQPAGVWETGTLPQSRAHTYVMDHGESLYRRSLYTIWRKSALIPDMDAFDAPNRMASCTRRQRSNTPLQALVTMNDPQWLEAARRLAERVMLKSPTTDARLDYLGRLVLGRPWAPDDRAVLVAELGQFRATYAGQTKAATELVEQGESRPNPAIAPTELAPWMLIASTALNLDATLNK